MRLYKKQLSNVKNRLFILSTALAIIFLFSTAYIKKSFANWVFPIDFRYGLSSSFGEYRDSHFHAGIDIRTNGFTGFPIHASGDGKIIRIRVVRRGYGKAIYIKHKNKLITVYGHLEKFENSKLGLEDIVRKMQKKYGKYPGNIFMHPPIPVKRGQVIGFSGESGAGLPHLHFEMRYGDTYRVNPFIFHYEDGLTDTSPPRIEKVVLVPLGINSFVYENDGIPSHNPLCITTKQYNKKTNRKHIFINGRIGIIAAAYDTMGASNRISPYKLELYLDKKLVVSCAFKKISFKNMLKTGLLYSHHFSHVTNPTKYFYRLFRLPGNKLQGFITPNEKPYYKNGIINTTSLLKRKITIKVKAYDAFGNHSSIRIPIRIKKPNFHPYKNNGKITKSKRANNNITLKITPFSDFVNLDIYSKYPIYNDLFAYAKIKNKTHAIKMRRYSLNHIGGDFSLKGKKINGLITFYVGTDRHGCEKGRYIAKKHIYAYKIEKRKRERIAQNDITLIFPPYSLYNDTYIFISKAPLPKEGIRRKGLLSTGITYRLYPNDIQFDKPVQLLLKQKTKWRREKYGIYMWDYIASRWIFIGNDSTISKYTGGKIRHFSTYALLADIAKPQINIKIEKGYNERKTITGYITDIGSGINIEKTHMTLDNKWLDIEYDPDRHWIQYKLPENIKAGLHLVKIFAEDRAKNRSLKILRFSIQ